MLAKINRQKSIKSKDLVEEESGLILEFNIEYFSVKFALIFIAEYDIIFFFLFYYFSYI